MKKRITVTIDSDLHEEIEKLPRSVSISEIVNWLLRVAVEEWKEGHELTTEELRKKAREMPHGEEFLRGMEEQFGPKIDKLMEMVEGIKKALPGKQKEKKNG